MTTREIFLHDLKQNNGGCFSVSTLDSASRRPALRATRDLKSEGGR